MTMKGLVGDLKAALMLNYTNPTDPEGNVKLQVREMGYQI